MSKLIKFGPSSISRLIGQLAIITILSTWCLAQQQVIQQPLTQITAIQPMAILNQQPQVQAQQLLSVQPFLQQPATIATVFANNNADGVNIHARNAAQTALIQAVSDTPISGASNEGKLA